LRIDERARSLLLDATMRSRSFACALAMVITACMGEAPPPDDGDSKSGGALGEDDKSESGESHGLRARVCASGATTRGIDVSYHNGTINWQAVKAGGVEFAFIRVSDGIGFKDPKFTTYWPAAKAAGLVRGVYQFFRPSQDVAAQADLLISALGGVYTPGDMPPVIDVEADGGLAPATVAARVRTWVDRVKTKLGVDPIVYTGKYFWRDEVGAPSGYANNPLWIAQYTSLCPDIPEPWTRWTFWQYTETGTVSGISGNVDINRFNGSLAELKAFANGTMPPPPPPASSCMSATLDREVDAGTCVQAASDAKWYTCTNGAWVVRSSSAGCANAFAWCSSATLGKNVPPRTCVQAQSDQIWYQCDGKTWVDPVNLSTGVGPAGTCSSEHAL
jgi:lysozyme